MFRDAKWVVCGAQEAENDGPMDRQEWNEGSGQIGRTKWVNKLVFIKIDLSLPPRPLGRVHQTPLCSLIAFYKLTFDTELMVEPRPDDTTLMACIPYNRPLRSL